MVSQPHSTCPQLSKVAQFGSLLDFLSCDSQGNSVNVHQDIKWLQEWRGEGRTSHHRHCENTAAKGTLCGDRIDPQYEKLGTEKADRIYPDKHRAVFQEGQQHI